MSSGRLLCLWCTFMSGENIEPILVKAASKSNGITSMVIGGIGLLLSIVWFYVTPDWLFLAGIFLTSASLVTLLVGWFKVREPAYSLAISPTEIGYHHRLRAWSIGFENLQRAGCPRVRQGLEHSDIEAVGFKLKSYAPFFNSISPRLITHLLMEQRPLLNHVTQEDCSTGGCYVPAMFDDKHFKLEDGTVLTGVKAMLANRMQLLREHLGFDVYIASSELDRAPDAFASLVNDCHRVSQQHLR